MRILAVLINVCDMDKAIDFYSNKLGFAVHSRKLYPQMVRLEHEHIALILFLVPKPVTFDYPRVAQRLLNFETRNLAASMNELRSRGVQFIHSHPQPCPVGAYVAFRDPFGNVHELLEARSL
jgi:catechol 2,3-dioxygenase-like lactoylglutathione lyase family enzyme